MADGLNRIDRSVVDGVLKDRSNWDLLSEGETSGEEESAGDRGETMEATGIQRILGHLDAKIDRFVEMSEASNRALERIASGLAGSANGNEVRRLNERLTAGAEQIEMLRAKLTQIEKHLALVIKNQKRLARILLDGKEDGTVFPGQTHSVDDHGV
jgi:DNA-directed RNA polymerase sigma subunit (sigma70/sigma32)